MGPHQVGAHVVRRHLHNPLRQRLELLVVPPLRLGHLGALLPRQHAKGLRCGPSPELRAHRQALLALEKPLRGLYAVPRDGKHCTEVEVRLGRVGPECDGLA
eukprot:scaffold6909_cov56-Phaeocystis_antarctica.AAC.3